MPAQTRRGFWRSGDAGQRAVQMEHSVTHIRYAAAACHTRPLSYEHNLEWIELAKAGIDQAPVV
jgi:hypothetical protein